MENKWSALLDTTAFAVSFIGHETLEDWVIKILIKAAKRHHETSHRQWGLNEVVSPEVDLAE